MANDPRESETGWVVALALCAAVDLFVGITKVVDGYLGALFVPLVALFAAAGSAALLTLGQRTDDKVGAGKVLAGLTVGLSVLALLSLIRLPA